MEKTFDTIYGEITCRYAFDPDTSMCGEGYFELLDAEGGYYGRLYGIEDVEELTPEIVEEQVGENLYA